MIAESAADAAVLEGMHELVDRLGGPILTSDDRKAWIASGRGRPQPSGKRRRRGPGSLREGGHRLRDIGAPGASSPRNVRLPDGLFVTAAVVTSRRTQHCPHEVPLQHFSPFEVSHLFPQVTQLS